MKILAIVPAYNESKNLPEVLKSLHEDAPQCDIVVVDDGSADATYKTAMQFQVNVLRLPINLGIGGAVQTGLKYAVEHDYDIALQVDGDGQHKPSEISKILKPIMEDESDLVIGSRYRETTGYQTPLLRRIGMIFFSKFTSLLMGQKITDTTSGFRALKRPVFNYLSRIYPVDFPDAEVLVMIHRKGFRIKEIPVAMNQRLSGKSSTTTLKSLYYPFKASLAILALLLQNKEKN